MLLTKTRFSIEKYQSGEKGKKQRVTPFILVAGLTFAALGSSLVLGGCTNSNIIGEANVGNDDKDMANNNETIATKASVEFNKVQEESSKDWSELDTYDVDATAKYIKETCSKFSTNISDVEAKDVAELAKQLSVFCTHAKSDVENGASNDVIMKNRQAIIDANKADELLNRGNIEAKKQKKEDNISNLLLDLSTDYKICKTLTISGSSNGVVGQTIKLNVLCKPENAEVNYEFKSSDNKLATVSNTGVVKLISDGIAKITVTDKNTGVSDSRNISITKKAEIKQGEQKKIDDTSSKKEEQKTVESKKEEKKKTDGNSSSGQSGSSSRQSGNSSGQSGNSSGQSGNSSGQSGSSSGQSGNSSGQSGNSSGQSGNSSGQSGNSSGQSGNSGNRVSGGSTQSDSSKQQEQKVVATGLTMDYSSLSMIAGYRYELNAYILWSNNTQSYNGIVWSSSNSSVASVSSTGYVTANSAGTATITASYGTFSKSCNVTVKAAQQTQPSTQTSQSSGGSSGSNNGGSGGSSGSNSGGSGGQTSKTSGGNSGSDSSSGNSGSNIGGNSDTSTLTLAEKAKRAGFDLNVYNDARLKGVYWSRYGLPDNGIKFREVYPIQNFDKAARIKVESRAGNEVYEVPELLAQVNKRRALLGLSPVRWTGYTKENAEKTKELYANMDEYQLQCVIDLHPSWFKDGKLTDWGVNELYRKSSTDACDSMDYALSHSLQHDGGSDINASVREFNEEEWIDGIENSPEHWWRIVDPNAETFYAIASPGPNGTYTLCIWCA